MMTMSRVAALGPGPSMSAGGWQVSNLSEMAWAACGSTAAVCSWGRGGGGGGGGGGEEVEDNEEEVAWFNPHG